MKISKYPAARIFWPAIRMAGLTLGMSWNANFKFEFVSNGSDTSNYKNG